MPRYVRVLVALFLAAASCMAWGQGATISSPAPGSVIGTSATFTWNDAGATGYQLWLGTTPGGYDIGAFPSPSQLTMGTSVVASGLPANGETIYARLWSRIGGVYVAADAMYTALTGPPPVLSFIQSPADGSMLTSSLATFQWNPGSATKFQLWLGTTPGGYDLGAYPSATGIVTGTSVTAGNVPTNGEQVYATLWQVIGNEYRSTSATYSTVTGINVPAAVYSPAPGSTLTGPSQTFQWNSDGATLYQLWIGSTPGSSDLGVFPPAATSTLSTFVTGLPTDGRTLYVRLVSSSGSSTLTSDVTFTAATITPAAIASPAGGSILAGASQLFQWNNAGATAYQLWLGSAPMTHDVGVYPNGGVTTATSLTATRIPTDGRTLYATLWSKLGGVFYSSAATFSAAVAPSVITSPVPGAAFSGTAFTFQWNNSGAPLNQLWIGSTPGAEDLGDYASSSLQASVVGLPTDGRTVYTRLWSFFGMTALFTDASFTAVSVDANTAAIISPAPGSLLPGPSQLFQWNNAGATSYQLWVGTMAGGSNVGVFPNASSVTTGTSTLATGLPTNGTPLYVRLWSLVNGTYYARDYTYATSVLPATITSPMPGATLSGPTQPFLWNNAGASSYELRLGSTPGASDITLFTTAGTRADLTGLPIDGRTIYATLSSTLGGQAFPTTATYSAVTVTAATISSPLNGSRLTGSSATFGWNDVHASGYQVWVGSVQGGSDVAVFPQGSGFSTQTTATISGLPTDGRTLFVRLWSNVGGRYYFSDSVFFASPI